MPPLDAGQAERGPVPRSVPEDLDPQVPVLPGHESLANLLMEVWALLAKGFGEEQLSIKNQASGWDLILAKLLEILDYTAFPRTILPAFTSSA